METLIPIAAKVQDVLGALGQNTNLDLPQIVVVGGQSSGKSSVLEGIVGRSFLPRGHGIVTRRPLILQMFFTNPHNSSIQRPDPEYETESIMENLDDDVSALSSRLDEWGVFSHLPGKRFYNFDEIRDEIIRDTEMVTGPNKGISPKAINLKIFSPNVLNLTLVDLPGIAKVAVGDQPEDIEEQIRTMCFEYISNPNAIILAVTAGNTDLANSDALQIAKQVDPHGERTVGVITKLDLMDPGTDASELLSNNVIPLQKGYVGVMNRGQIDINNKMSIREGLKKEDQFFRSHPGYRNKLDKCGTSKLAKLLNSILMHHIRDCLPSLKNKIAAMVHDLDAELDSLGSPNTPQNLSGTLLTLLSKFTNNFTSCLAGHGMPNASKNGLLTTDLYGGARIAFIFHQVFVRSLMDIHPFDGLTDDEIRTTIANANGTRSALFVPEQSFDVLVKRQISRLEQPGLQCVDLVFDELNRMSLQCEPTELTRFPVLREKMVDVVGRLLRKSVSPTQLMVTNLIQIELSYINTNHPDFIGGGRAVSQLMQDMGNEDKEEKQGEHMNDTNANEFNDAFSHDQNGISSSTPPKDKQKQQRGGSLMNFIFNKSPQPSTNGPPSLIQLPQVPSTIPPPPQISTRAKIETRIIKSLIASYFNIVRKNYIDMVPKTIMYFLVNHSRDAMQNDLVQQLYNGDDAIGLAGLMKEADDVEKRRKTCMEMRDLLQKALEIVNEVRDFHNFEQ